jgi:hypothetical protein
VLLLVYVDDLLIVDNAGNGLETGKVNKEPSRKYKMTDRGEAKRFIGLEVIKAEKAILWDNKTILIP